MARHIIMPPLTEYIVQIFNGSMLTCYDHKIQKILSENLPSYATPPVQHTRIQLTFHFTLYRVEITHNQSQFTHIYACIHPFKIQCTTKVITSTSNNSYQINLIERRIYFLPASMLMWQ